MISKNRIKLIRSLQLKKYRQKYNKFICEGAKIAMEVLRDAPGIVEAVYVSPELAPSLSKLTYLPLTVVPGSTIKSISALESNEDCLLVCQLPEPYSGIPRLKSHAFYLDNIRDPGNLGTIIRLCDWFGMETLYLSEGCVDPYNPKTIQASMGSFLRIKLVKMPFDEVAGRFAPEHVFIADMEGRDYRDISATGPMIFVLGNESNGVSEEIKAKVDQVLTIKGKSTKVESLNVAVSAAILASHFTGK